MDRLKEMLGHIKDGIKSEMVNIKKLKGKRFDRFCEIFHVPGDADIYYNDYNIILIDEDINNIVSSYVSKKEYKIMRVEIKEFNANIWVYQYYNDQLFETFLNEG